MEEIPIDEPSTPTRKPLRVKSARDSDAFSDLSLEPGALTDPLAQPDLGPMLPPPPSGTGAADDQARAAHRGRMLVLSFCAMVVVGLGNKLFQKLMTLPMHNYPNFLNLLTTFCYIPLSFAYIIPAAASGRIDAQQLRLPKRPFAVMGLLDAIAGILQVFAATYLPGGLIGLLMQAATPVSMVLSRVLLKTQYDRTHYVGALIVGAGIVTVLWPLLLRGDDDGSSGSGEGDDDARMLLWSVVLIVSCVPMCLSAVYKEIALGETELDPVYLNGWIAIFQFLASLPLAVPAALATAPPVAPSELPENLLDGGYCWVGRPSIACDDDAADGRRACCQRECLVDGRGGETRARVPVPPGRQEVSTRLARD